MRYNKDARLLTEAYTLIYERFISEIEIEAAKLDIPTIEQWELNLLSKSSGYFIPYLEELDKEQPNMDGTRLIRDAVQSWMNPMCTKAYRHLIDMHELEYKISELNKFYNQPEAIQLANKALYHLANWLVIFMKAILNLRNLLDVLCYDENKGLELKTLKTLCLKNANTIEAVHSNSGATSYGAALVELENARSLSEKLIAISKALNSEHDAGPLFGGGFDLTAFTPTQYEYLSNLNYRKMQKEIQQEFA